MAKATSKRHWSSSPSRLKSRRSEQQHLPRLNPFRGKGATSKKHQSSSPSGSLRCSKRDNKASRRKGSTQVGKHKLKPPLSQPHPFPVQVSDNNPFPQQRLHFSTSSRQRVIDPQARPGQNVYQEGWKIFPTPFQHSAPVYNIIVSQSSIQIKEKRAYWAHPTKTILWIGMCPIRFLSTLSPYSRKPSPFGPNMSVCAKGVSRGVHNIAFSLSPDRFRAFDLFFFLSFGLGWASWRPSKLCVKQQNKSKTSVWTSNKSLACIKVNCVTWPMVPTWRNSQCISIHTKQLVISVTFCGHRHEEAAWA